MKYHDFLDDILGQKSKIKALRYFVKFPDGISVRELSRRIGLTEPNLSVVLKGLEKNGVLTGWRQGTALVFKLNKSHYLVNDFICPLFKREQSALRDAGKFITERIKTGYISLIIFGSAARSEDRPKSDLDLAFIAKDARTASLLEKELAEINADFIKKFGNMLAPFIITRADFLKKAKAGDPLIREITREGKVLAGKMISEIL